jgi:hypothetical protein
LDAFSRRLEGGFKLGGVAGMQYAKLAAYLRHGRPLAGY